MQGFKEGNACWNCRYINKCKPLYRPLLSCGHYAPLGEPISHQKIGEILGIERSQVECILRRCGADKIVELLSDQDYIVRYDLVGRYRRFYLLSKTITTKCEEL